MRWLLFVWAILVPYAGSAQELHHPKGPDPYVGWRGLGGIDCCSGRDCVAAEPCRAADGRYGWMEEGQCWPFDPLKFSVPPLAVLQTGKPLHVCRVPIRLDGRIVQMDQRCWYLATGS